MAKSTKARLDCRALPYLQPRARQPEPADLEAAFLRPGSSSPARAAVEARSDLSAIATLVDTLTREGLTRTVAASAAYEVLANPTVAAQRKNGTSTDIVQSVVLERDDDLGELQVVVYLQTVPGRPPTFTVTAVEVQYVDLFDIDAAAELVACVEQWWADYPMPNVRVPEPLPLQDWAWFGDATHSGLREVPADWRDRLKAAGGVYGVQPFIAETQGKVAAQNLADRVDFVFAGVGAKWVADFPPESASNDITVEVYGQRAETFDEVLDLIRKDLLSKASASTGPPPRSRDLDRGEVVYHRKVGGSRKFDHFDAGSDTPCIHGADAFIRWSGDKATKGMARRYDNFNPDMLIHCNRKMNCGMYGVDASRGGHKPLPASTTEDRQDRATSEGEDEPPGETRDDPTEE